MGRTVGELEASMTTEEFARWVAFHRRSPISLDRTDILFARLCLVVCQVAGAKKKTGGAFALEDFLMFQPKEAKPLSFLRSHLGALVQKGRKKRRGR
jgi:hypothetical protein